MKPGICNPLRGKGFKSDPLLLLFPIRQKKLKLQIQSARLSGFYRVHMQFSRFALKTANKSCSSCWSCHKENNSIESIPLPPAFAATGQKLSQNFGQTIKRSVPSESVIFFRLISRQEIMGQRQPRGGAHILKLKGNHGFGVQAGTSLTTLSIQNPGKGQFAGRIDFAVFALMGGDLPVRQL